MSKREHRHFTAERKLKILREADQLGVTASEVCRRHAALGSGGFRPLRRRNVPFDPTCELNASTP